MWKQDESVKPDTHGPLSADGAATQAGQAKVIMDLGKSLVIKGELNAFEDLTVCGHMEGTIKLPDHTLTIGPHANIKAGISAKNVVIMGAVIGDVFARERVEIQTSGSVTGDIASPCLVIAEGGQLRGRVEMTARVPGLPVDAPRRVV